MAKRQNVNGFTRKGFILQAVAVAQHHKNAQQLKEIANRIGRERIQVLHGGADRLITANHGELLALELGAIR